MQFEPGKIYENGSERRFVISLDGEKVSFTTPLKMAMHAPETTTPEEFAAWFAQGGLPVAVPRCHREREKLRAIHFR